MTNQNGGRSLRSRPPLLTAVCSALARPPERHHLRVRIVVVGHLGHMYRVAFLGHQRRKRKHLVAVAGDFSAAKDAGFGLADFAVAAKLVDKILRRLQAYM